ncbi:ScbR family autoregulator-binding transcription factor [Mycolicibacterium sp. XJ1819]
MARRSRAQATRRHIVNSAVQIFSEIGYASAGLNLIIDRAQMTKGALYYHFDSKESLASAIIEEGNANLFHAFRNVDGSSSPAFETLLHGSFVVVDAFNADLTARVAVQLMRTLAGFNNTAARAYTCWLDEMSARAATAVEEGDLHRDLDPRAVGETVLGAVIGVELLSDATSSGADVLRRVTRMWEVLLPAVVTTASLPYFREYLARESLRYAPPSSTPIPTPVRPLN